MRARGFSHSVIGSREMNQDSALVWDEGGLYAVADGVGGGIGGEVASAMSTQGLRHAVRRPADLRQAFESIQGQVLKRAMDEHGGPVMGTTLTAALFADPMIYVCHVGDSRLYVLDPDHGLQLKTQDHEFYDESLGATVLASYLGIPSDEHPLQILEDVVPAQPGQRLLLCSDGLYRQLPEVRIVELIREYRDSPRELVERLCQEAAEEPYSDNVTVVYVEIEESFDDTP